MGRFSHVLLFLFFSFFTVFVMLPSPAYAATVSIIGKASVMNTADTYLGFGNYNSNVTINTTSGDFSGYAFLEDVGWVAFGTTDNADGPVNVNLTSGAVTGKAKILTTDANIDFSNYNSNVTVNTSTGVFSGYVFSEDIGWLNFSDTGVNTGGTALVSSSSSSSSGNSSSNTTSSTASAPTCDSQAPSAAPSLYSATAQDGDSITLSFTDAGVPVDHYTLLYGTSAEANQWGGDNIGGNGTRTYTVNNLVPGTTYYFRVRAGNGCAAGAWSNTISASTKGIVALNQLQITKSELKPLEEKPSDVIEEKSKEKVSQKTEAKTYALRVKVVDNKGLPVEGAKVTIHSEVKEAVTDKSGIAQLQDVESGEHKVLIAYNGFKGEQAINLTGDVKEFSLNLTVKPQTVVFSEAAISIIVLLLVVIAGLVVYVVRLKKKFSYSGIRK